MTLSAALTTIAAAATAVAVVLGTRQLRRRIRPQKPFLSVFADTTDQPFPHLPPQPDDDDDDFQQRCCDSGCSSGGSGGDNTVAASTAAAPGATAAAAAAPLPEAAPGRRGAAAGGSLPAVHPYLTRIKRLMASTECPILRHPPQPPPLPPQITNQPKPPSIAPAAAAPPPPPAVAAAAQGCSTSGSRPAATRGSVLPGFQLHWVSSPKQLYWLGQRLRQERQIGLDTEASPLLCYHGRVCLIQLSVWDDTASPCDGGDDGGSSGCSSGSGGSGGGGGHVWLVDALALRGHVGAALGGLMADPRVVKVLHGGGNDVVWLQRDFRVYLVNVFDTEKASQASGGRGEGAGGRGHPEVVLHQQYPCDWCDQWRSLLPSLLLLLPGNPFEAHMCGPACFWLFLKVLGYENRALASLLSRIVGLDVGAEKAAGQRADWRRRPLPPALLRYAAADVAYLPYLADVLRRELAALGPPGRDWPNPPPPPRPADPVLGHRTPAAGEEPPQRPGTRHVAAPLLSLTLYKKPLSDAAVATGSAAPAGTATTAAAAVLRKFFSAAALPQQIVTATSGAAPSGAAAVAGAAGATVTATAAAAGAVLALCRWRDATARRLDLGPQRLLPDVAVAALAAVRPPPAGGQALLRLVSEQLAAANQGLQAEPYTARYEICTALRSQAEALSGLLTATAAGRLTAATAAASAAVSSAVEAGSRAVHQPGDLAAAGAAGRRTRHDPAAARERRSWLIEKFSAKTQVYQNCRMLSHEGQLLCFCDSRKLRWYLNKGLAVQVCEDPPTIQLLFEHQNTDQKLGEQLGGHRATGREGVREGEGGTDDFYTQSKSNRCVGCGCSSHYLRYRVLPACYRRHMPSALKSHRSHDVVLLCIDCHELAQKRQRRLLKLGFLRTPKRWIAVKSCGARRVNRPWQVPHMFRGGSTAAVPAPRLGSGHSACRDFGPYSVYASREGPQRQEECGAPRFCIKLQSARLLTAAVTPSECTHTDHYKWGTICVSGSAFQGWHWHKVGAVGKVHWECNRVPSWRVDTPWVTPSGRDYALFE
ncbi:hypothetical protein VOLCADRAFT_106481 [Volvox carteri f. nagariensis]|uniref:3'-5' exonuclease domain-containing protein n=1 Tax=Volvox carteri f. nagariensis TaxID=3068 RepID=D8U7P1_VOLCA|nr:uncharacterized protein VOLCADRAFT_106481 [Volvox carteri f. nagariensis]EFJ44336.1 hypothetical protein VOLCADRAFT_106481 [Volvox carteri f. nagariensis]|eukprot:XP_002954695.1 hypothetical protein VOLCADRAFT_106481 [Volvox carteri f. nagariensis]